ncbi:MAG: penicillin-binding protein 2 [bacterium]|nr:penicillin-binding protein 2 [bacterium]
MPDEHLIEIHSAPIESGGNLNGKYKHQWVEESFDFEDAVGRQPGFLHTREHLGLSIIDKKMRYLLYIFLIGLSIIALRLAFVQIIKGNYFASLAEGNRIRLRPIASERGIIFDRSGKELVQNVPNFSLSVVPQDLPRNPTERYNVINKISIMSGVSQTDIENLLQKYKFYSFESLVIKENLDYDTALKLYIQNADLPGILIEKGTKRHYLTDQLNNFTLSHFLGYLGKLNDTELTAFRNNGYQPSDYLGRTGLEKQYEAELRGTYGKKKIEVNALGKEQSVLAEEAPMPGNNLHLTVDIKAQTELERLIHNQLVRIGKQRAAAIALDPTTGGIVAMVSWPSFDNNQFANGINSKTYKAYTNDVNHPFLNRAIAGMYPSGSTIKLIIAAASLQENIITKATTVQSTGGLDVGGHLFRDWKAGGHGTTNVTRAIAWSVNTFFYYVGGGYKNFVGLGVDKITEYMRKFNLGKKLGLDLPGEADGFVPSKDWKQVSSGEKWYVGDTYNLSIGQGNLLVTPLQVAVWTAAIANGGKVMRPHLVDYFSEGGSAEKNIVQPTVLAENIVSSANIDIVKQGMRQCVTDGSCKLLGTLPFATGGKTGTAQWNATKDDHAWFTGFAPYDQPKIVITILIEEGVEGSSASMPVARDFLAWWGNYIKTN